MMGGQRVGKSSALAAMMDAFLKAPISYLLEAKDQTELAYSGNEKQESIQKKLNAIRCLIEKRAGKTILVDSNKTNVIWNYTLHFSVPNNNIGMDILFTDVNGEFYDSGGVHQEEVLNLVESSDVFIIAIDTPYLMEAVNPDNPWVNPVINEKYNFVEDIHTFLSNINEKNDTGAKLVIFTPIKCEKWAEENKLKEVIRQVKSVFATPITALSACENVQIEFLPIQTTGTIRFKEHLPAKVFSGSKRYLFFFSKSFTSKCSPISDAKIRLSDGAEVSGSEGKIEDDPEAVLIPNTTIIRPNSWFEVTSKEYRPHNCEQLALHILAFMLAKLIDAKIRKEKTKSAFLRGIERTLNVVLNISTLGMWSAIKDYFGDIPLEKMEEIIQSMRTQHLIKEAGEGIEIYKRIEFLTKV